MVDQTSGDIAIPKATLLTLHCSNIQINLPLLKKKKKKVTKEKENIQFGTICLAKLLPLMCSEICNKSFKAVFPIPAISLNCVKMLPAVIRAELNYIRAGSCVATPSVCLYRAHTRFFLLFAARRSCCLFLFLLTSPSLKGRCPESIAFAQFISGQVNRAE